MTTGDALNSENSSELAQNLSKLEDLSARFIAAISEKKEVNTAINAPGSDLYVKAAGAFWQAYANDPAKFMAQQVSYWGESVKEFIDLQTNLTAQGGKIEAAEPVKDRRFIHPLWSTNPYFTFVKDQYLLNSKAMRDAISQLDGLDETQTRRLRYFTDQVIDMMAPTNFLGTNPEALEKAVETQGQSLIDGLENLISDMEANEGELIVRLADEDAFSLGENIATTPGKVVFRNHMHELIQYAPSTKEVYDIPLIIFPPWINKFYILDLKEQNSFIKWAVDQGFTVFVVSWVNPDNSYDKIALEDYIEHGYLTAFETARAIAGSEKVNAVGYCIGGTTLALTLALLKQREDNPVSAATFFTTLTDFSQQGDFLPFLQNDFIDGIEQEVEKKGILKSYVMARTFSFLRSNDLIYRPAIESYMLGNTPPAFDLLYWNGDGTNLPGAMAVQYLRGLCQSDRFANEGFPIFDTIVRLRDVDVPLCAIGCETDHIAPWKDSFRGVQKMGSRSKRFIMSQSGHIAGIVNPPNKKKYGHYTNADLTLSPEEWLQQATFVPGSWWEDWGTWLAGHAGPKKPAGPVGSDAFKPISDAPGTYVRVRSSSQNK